MAIKDVRGGIPKVLVASAARTTSSNTGNLIDTTANFPVSGSYSLYWNVTALSPDNTAVVSVETSPDGGTTWLTAARFTSISGLIITTTSIQRRLDFQNGLAYGAAGTEAQVAPFSSSTTASVNSNTRLTRDVRIAWDLGAAGTSCTFAVYGIFEP